MVSPLKKQKICTKCSEIKDMTMFHRNKSNPDGRAANCKACVKLYYQENKERVIESSRAYYATNKENRKLPKKEKQFSNDDGAYQKQHEAFYNEEHIYTLREKSRECQSKKRKKEKSYYERNKDKIVTKSKEYYKEHRDEILTKEAKGRQEQTSEEREKKAAYQRDWYLKNKARKAAEAAAKEEKRKKTSEYNRERYKKRKLL